MQIFWIVITILVGGTGVFVFMPDADTSQGTALPTAQAQLATADVVATDVAAAVETKAIDGTQVEEAPIDTAIPEIVDETEGKITAEISDEQSQSEDIADAAPVPAPVSAPEIAVQDIAEDQTPVAPEITADDILASLDNMTGAIDILPTTEEQASGKLATEESEAPTSWEELAAKAHNDESAQTNADAGEEEAAPVIEAVTVLHNDDGSITIGDQFNITGKGLQEDPYILPWEFMVSIRDYYSPREGKKAIPQHLAMFDGRYISIGGYLQFPLATPEPRECLVMLNQWDGCCIGVPPTPYDAIEVSLSEPALREQKFAVEGRIVGRLKIDPYLVGNWLIGLYLLTDASVDVSSARSVEEVYGSPLPQFDQTNE